MSVQKLLIAICCALATIVPAGAKPQGYLIKQNVTYQGALNIEAAQSGIHVESKELGIYFRPEIKGILLLNRANKKYCIVDPKEWFAGKEKKGFVTDIKKRRVSTYRGLHVQEYAGRMEDSRHKFMYVVQFWATKDVQLPQSVVNNYSKVFGLPEGYGLPMRLVRWYKAGRPMVFLSTEDFKVADVKPAQTKPVLAGYQKVADEMDVMMAEAPDEDINSILKDSSKTKPAASRLR